VAEKLARFMLWEIALNLEHRFEPTSKNLILNITRCLLFMRLVAMHHTISNIFQNDLSKCVYNANGLDVIRIIFTREIAT